MVSILGIDPGLSKCGVAIIHCDGVLTDMRCAIEKLQLIKTKSKHGLIDRLSTIEESISSIIDTYNIDEIAIEEPFFNRVNWKTLLTQGYTIGYIFNIIRKYSVTVYNNKVVKETVTGTGNADKHAVEKWVRWVFKIKDDFSFKSQDVSDALAIAYTHWVKREVDKQVSLF